ncbi:hypothetical protein, partial [Bradyrhizobium sp. SZCCHNS3053]|uniref:hypothetical protein n=1 Tax=Bradyrhizobium sp. SZCCHNS3053 TaxID=3057322 RepID=UPI0029168327
RQLHPHLDSQTHVLSQEVRMDTWAVTASLAMTVPVGCDIASTITAVIPANAGIHNHRDWFEAG